MCSRLVLRWLQHHLVRLRQRLAGTAVRRRYRRMRARCTLLQRHLCGRSGRQWCKLLRSWGFACRIHRARTVAIATLAMDRQLRAQQAATTCECLRMSSLFGCLCPVSLQVSHFRVDNRIPTVNILSARFQDSCQPVVVDVAFDQPITYVGTPITPGPGTSHDPAIGLVVLTLLLGLAVLVQISVGVNSS